MGNQYLKLRNLVVFYVWEDAVVWAHWNHSFDIYLTSLEPVSCVFTSWLSRLTVEHDCGLMAARWQVFFPSWVPSGLRIDGSCSHWWLWDPLFTDRAGNILLLNSIRWMYHNLFIYSPTNDHSGCLWFWLLQIKLPWICIVLKKNITSVHT